MVKSIIIFEGTVVDTLPQFAINNFGSTVTFHLINENGSAFNLTDYTVTLKAKNLNNFNEYLLSKSVTVDTAISGYCSVIFEDGDLVESGSFNCSLVLTKTDYEVTIPIGYLDITDTN